MALSPAAQSSNWLTEASCMGTPFWLPSSLTVLSGITSETQVLLQAVGGAQTKTP